MDAYFAIALTLALAQGHFVPDIKTVNNEVQNWAVLIAGSDGWYNYRHQADVCHAYQILHSHGIPDERIIVFMQDDIANNEKNPFPGKLFNGPLSYEEPRNGPEVYHDVPKDYTGQDFTEDAVYDVLMGRTPASGSGKTLKSGSNDNIFIYYTDHGSEGLSALPCTACGLLATKVNEALKSMQAKRMFNKMLIYWESCHSGSMFFTEQQWCPANNTAQCGEELLPSKDILAITAARPNESSYATYDSATVGTFLGDEFSVSWMEDTDKRGDLTKVTVGEQVETVKEKVTESSVQVYGDKSIMEYDLGMFLGSKAAEPINHARRSDSGPKVSQHEAALYTMAKSKGVHYADHMKVAQEKMLDTVLSILKPHISHNLLGATSTSYNLDKLTPDDMEKCYYPLLKAFGKKCYDVNCNYYAYAVTGHFIKACTGDNKVDGVYEAFEDVIESMDKVCDINIRNSVCGVE